MSVPVGDRVSGDPCRHSGLLSGSQWAGWCGPAGGCRGPCSVWAAGELPSSFVDGAVVGPAEQGQVVQVGKAAVGPVGEVVGVGPGGWAVAAGEDAAAVAHDQCGAQRGWDGAGAPADVQRLAGAVGDDPGDPGVAGDPPGGFPGDGAGPAGLGRAWTEDG